MKEILFFCFVFPYFFLFLYRNKIDADKVLFPNDFLLFISQFFKL